MAYYGKDCVTKEYLESISEHFLAIHGSKFQNLHQYLTRDVSFFQRYDHIMVADDDLIMNTAQINDLFSQAERFQTDVMQPSFSRKGRVSWPVTASEDDSNQFRLTNFVEMTCPLFTSRSLSEFMSEFDGSLVGFGTDWWYCNVIRRSPTARLGISDRISVVNPFRRPKSKQREIDLLQREDDRRRQFSRIKKERRLQIWEHQTLERIPISKSPDENRSHTAMVGLTPRMNNEEFIFFQERLAACSGVYVEYGVGGSTIEAARSKVQKIISVESDASWLKKVTEIIKFNENSYSRLSFCHVDFGYTSRWGYPADIQNIDRLRILGRTYSMRGIIECRQTNIWPSLILLDGRFRNACLFAWLIEWMTREPRLFWPDVLLHDFRADRSYRRILQAFDISVRVSTFVSLLPKDDVKLEDVMELYLSFCEDPE